MRFKIELCIVVLFLALIAQGGPASAQMGGPYPGPRLDPAGARVLLLIPDTFAGYVYTSTYHGRPTTNRFGEESADLFPAFLGREFAALDVRYVGSEAEAMAMVDDRASEDLAAYDYIAIPRFDNVSYWSKPAEYGFDVDLIVSFYPITGGVYTSIRGHGETRTGAWSGSSPGASGSLALRYAVDAVRDGVIKWRRNGLS